MYRILLFVLSLSLLGCISDESTILLIADGPGDETSTQLAVSDVVSVQFKSLSGHSFIVLHNILPETVADEELARVFWVELGVTKSMPTFESVQEEFNPIDRCRLVLSPGEFYQTDTNYNIQPNQVIKISCLDCDLADSYWWYVPEVEASQ